MSEDKYVSKISSPDFPFRIDSTYLERPEIVKAMQLADEFKNHCFEHNIPKSAEIMGVAWCVDSVKKRAFTEGKKSVIDRINKVLGLTT